MTDGGSLYRHEDKVDIKAEEETYNSLCGLALWRSAGITSLGPVVIELKDGAGREDFCVRLATGAFSMGASAPISNPCDEALL